MEIFNFRAVHINPLDLKIVDQLEYEYGVSFKRDEFGVWWWCETTPRVVEGGGELLEKAYQVYKREEKLKRIIDAHIL